MVKQRGSFKKWTGRIICIVFFTSKLCFGQNQYLLVDKKVDLNHNIKKDGFRQIIVNDCFKDIYGVKLTKKIKNYDALLLDTVFFESIENGTKLFIQLKNISSKRTSFYDYYVKDKKNRIPLSLSIVIKGANNVTSIFNYKPLNICYNSTSLENKSKTKRQLKSMKFRFKKRKIKKGNFLLLTYFLPEFSNTEITSINIEYSVVVDNNGEVRNLFLPPVRRINE